MLDVFSLAQLENFQESQTWEVCPDGGFWCPENYIALNRACKYPDNVTLRQTFVITNSPYCTCSELLKKWQYLLGTAMPTLVLGGGSAAAAVMTNQLLIFLQAEYMFASGGGDFLTVLKGMLHHTGNAALQSIWRIYFTGNLSKPDFNPILIMYSGLTI